MESLIEKLSRIDFEKLANDTFINLPEEGDILTVNGYGSRRKEKVKVEFTIPLMFPESPAEEFLLPVRSRTQYGDYLAFIPLPFKTVTKTSEGKVDFNSLDLYLSTADTDLDFIPMDMILYLSAYTRLRVHEETIACYFRRKNVLISY